MFQNNKENASEVTVDYHPKLIRLQWFPFMNQPGYRSPIMFAKFNNLTLGVIYKVRVCLMLNEGYSVCVRRLLAILTYLLSLLAIMGLEL